MAAMLLLCVAGCGARTGLGLDEDSGTEMDGGRRDGGPRDAFVPPRDRPLPRDVFVPPDVPDPIDTGPRPDTGPPPCRCNDGVACTVDTCDEPTRICTFTPDPDLCPISHRCDDVLGCIARVVAHWAGDIHEVDVPGGTNRFISTAPTDLTDLALHPDRTLYGVDFLGRVLIVDELTGGVTPVVTLMDAPGLNALDAAPDGTLYAAGGNEIFRVDIATGTLRRVARFDSGVQSSGDLAFLPGGRMVATTRFGFGDPRFSPDDLVEVDLTSGITRYLGNIGHACVWGLAAFGETLYGLTCNGTILTIDPRTGFGRMISSSTIEYWGATAR